MGHHHHVLESMGVTKSDAEAHMRKHKEARAARGSGTGDGLNQLIEMKQRTLSQIDGSQARDDVMAEEQANRDRHGVFTSKELSNPRSEREGKGPDGPEL